MDFCRETVDFCLITRESSPAVYKFLLNIFVYFGLYVRQSMINPTKKGCNAQLSCNVFDKLKLLPWSPGQYSVLCLNISTNYKRIAFEEVTVEMLPAGLRKPKTACQSKKRKPLDIAELHHTFRLLTTDASNTTAHEAQSVYLPILAISILMRTSSIWTSEQLQWSSIPPTGYTIIITYKVYCPYTTVRIIAPNAIMARLNGRRIH